jgi:hypothetical protein
LSSAQYKQQSDAQHCGIPAEDQAGRQLMFGVIERRVDPLCRHMATASINLAGDAASGRGSMLLTYLLTTVCRQNAVLLSNTSIA